MLMLKKIAKTLDEMAKNEELMSGILAAAEEDAGAPDMQGEGEYTEGGEGQQRLITIGEDGEEDKHFDTQFANKSGAKKKQV